MHGNLVYVANAGGAARTSPGSRSHPGAASSSRWPARRLPLPNGSQPDDVLFNSTGTNLVGNLVGTSQIEQLQRGPDGLLTAAPGLPLPAQGLGPFGSEFRPTNPSSCSSPMPTTRPA